MRLAEEKTADRGARWLDAALEEYRSLRGEILDAIRGQHNALRLGVGAVVIIIGAAFSNLDDPFVAGLFLLVLVPIVSYLTLISWNLELFRMARIGYAVALCERRINRWIDQKEDALSWESRRRTIKTQARPLEATLHIASVLAFFGISVLGSLIAGSVLLIGTGAGRLLIVIDLIQMSCLFRFSYLF